MLDSSIRRFYCLFYNKRSKYESNISAVSRYRRLSRRFISTNFEKVVVASLVCVIFFATDILLVAAVLLFALVFAKIVVFAVVIATAVILLVVAAIAVAVILTFVIAVAAAALCFEVVLHSRSCFFSLAR